MTNRDRIVSALSYKPYDRLPIVHFGFLPETLTKWHNEGHLNDEQLAAAMCADEDIALEELTVRLGFDCAYHRVFAMRTRLNPPFDRIVLECMPDGSRKVMTPDGAIVVEKDNAGSIPMEVDHVLKGRKEWEEVFLPRLQFSPDRIENIFVNCGYIMRQFDSGGKDFLCWSNREEHYLLHCGSLYGVLRDYIGMENLCYLAADDEDLLIEMIDVNAELCYQCVKYALENETRCDIAHFWEDICYKNGPLVNPRFFHKHVGPHYKRITDLLASHGVTLVSLDCDGLIDTLIPTWVENGVNIMFPIEVGTWNASIEPWKQKYGNTIRGVGGMCKHVFALDYVAVDAEIERLKPLVDLGGYVPCPDHRIADDAKWENVQYYCDAMRKAFG